MEHFQPTKERRTSKMKDMPRPKKQISDFDVRLGAVVKYRRTKKPLNFSQKDLSLATGIPLSNLQRREEGTNEFTVSEIERIARVLDVRAAELVREALDDYGGIDKLIRESVSDPRPTVDDVAQRR